MARTTSRLAAGLLFATAPLLASVIGINPPAKPLTRPCIEQLPAAERGPWLAYLEKSERQRQADKDLFAAGLKRSGLASQIDPPHGFAARSMPLDREASWYAGMLPDPAEREIVLGRTPQELYGFSERSLHSILVQSGSST